MSGHHPDCGDPEQNFLMMQSVENERRKREREEQERAWDKKYPQHAALRLVKNDSQKLGQFLEWMSEQGWTICHLKKNAWEEEYTPTYHSINKVLAAYFGIDEVALSNEKDAMVEELHRSNEGAEPVKDPAKNTTR